MTVLDNDFEDDNESYVKGEKFDLINVTAEDLVILQERFDAVANLPSEEDRIEAAKKLVQQMYGE